jgi:hypothetical protein
VTLEYGLKKWFENEKAIVVRSAGSHGVADLGVFPTEPISLDEFGCHFTLYVPAIIQSKRYKKDKPKPAKEFLNIKANGWPVQLYRSKLHVSRPITNEPKIPVFVKFWATKKRGELPYLEVIE